MKAILGVVFFGLILAFTSASANAACGGGGWHPPAPKPGDPVPAGQPVTGAKPAVPATTVQSALPTPAPRQVVEVAGVALDTSKFDAMTSRLQLSEHQWKDVNRAKEKVRDQSEKLVKNQAKAQRKLAQCEGDCSSEERKLAKTSDELKNYNPNQDFEERLNDILSSSQLATYRATPEKTVSDAKKNP